MVSEIVRVSVCVEGPTWSLTLVDDITTDSASLTRVTTNVYVRCRVVVVVIVSYRSVEVVRTIGTGV